VVSWARAREKGSKECVGCLSQFSQPPASDKERTEVEKDNEISGKKRDADDSEEQKASESGRYECRACESHFCIDCDMFAHMVLHNCPGCLSKLDASAIADAGNGDVEMSG
jgi:transcription initiation factor TFIIH subunit 2